MHSASSSARRSGSRSGASPAPHAALVAVVLVAFAACTDGDPTPSRPLPEGQPALPGISAPDPRLGAQLEAASRAQDAGFASHPGHLRTDGSPQFTNRLILQNSPYLLQHAHNPVNWYPWGEAAFERAAREHKAVFLSIGYSTCHWCHVMEIESFEDIEIATYLNEHFIAVKVDREERPDLDDVYMQAVQALSGRGGWPMTLVLTPAREPFFAATYIPPRDGVRGAGKGLLTILRELDAAYRDDPARVGQQARALSAELSRAAAGRPPANLPGREVIVAAVAALRNSFDATDGGFGRAPKFPRPVALELLLRDFQRSGAADALQMVELTLEKMAAGGIHDQIGGGFHRYSTDRRWLVPHFEKMLYDNAQLARLYLHAFQTTGRRDFAQVARETLDYLRREMSAPQGGFASATDADSRAPDGQMHEGLFFTWTAAELEQTLGAARARAAGGFFAVTAAGNLDGRSILHTPATLDQAAASLGLSSDALGAEIEASRALLYVARARRTPPLRDDKVLVSWNALAISAFAEAAFVLERPDYAAAATGAAQFVLSKMRDERGRLLRSFRDGEAHLDAVLDDYAFFIRALLDLYEATFDPCWIDAALSLQKVQDDEFSDPAGGGYFLTGSHGEPLLTRSKPADDQAEPSGNSVAAENLLRLYDLTADESWRARAEASLSAFATAMAEQPASMPQMLAALDRLLSDPVEVAIVATGDRDPDADRLAQILRGRFMPHSIRSIATDPQAVAAQARRIPWMEDKQALGGRATAYVCQRGSCKQPTSDPDLFERQLRQAASDATLRPAGDATSRPAGREVPHAAGNAGR